MNLNYSFEEAAAIGEAPWKNPINDDHHVAIFKELHPISEGHLVFVPKYAANGIINDCFSDALKYGQDKVKAGDWDGFNINLNWGRSAGETAAYPHVHLIPRRRGDKK